MGSQNKYFELRGDDVLSLIRQQHAILHKYIGCIKNEKLSVLEKQKCISCFIDFFSAYLKAGEVTLYRVLEQTPNSEAVVGDVIEDHAIARILIEELEELDFANKWNSVIASRARTMARVVEKHLLQEQNEFLNKAVQVLGAEELYGLGKQFQSCLGTFQATDHHYAF